MGGNKKHKTKNKQKKGAVIKTDLVDNPVTLEK
jgi:hypothetical protein